MKLEVLSIVPTLVFVAATACKSAPEPERSPPPMERTERTEPIDDEVDEPVAQPEPRADDAEVTTDRIHEQVHAALDRAEGLDASRIRVVVADNGVVHLSGIVGSEEEKRRAHEIAHSVAGVKNVYFGELEVDMSRAQR